MRHLTLALLLLAACDGGPADTAIDTDTDTDTDTASGDCADRDADGDGVSACDDCDDNDGDVFPGAPERCDGVDSDCDGSPHPTEADDDGDGSPDCDLCDDAGWWGPLVRDDADASVVLSTLRADLGSVNPCIDYRTSREVMFLEMDKVNGQVECVYTGTKVSIGTDLPDSTVMNTEHTWPQSMGAENEPAKCDLNHLFPVTADSNSRRSNNPFGLVARDVSWQEGGSRLGEASDGRTVFEPRPVHRGDVARAMYLFALRYSANVSAGDRSSFWLPQKPTMIQWHSEDPPDAWERRRAAYIADVQGHPNPFVVCPTLLGKVEGDL